eukprot:jgi/Mesvir1/16588/Mv10123-RA.1
MNPTTLSSSARSPLNSSMEKAGCPDASGVDGGSEAKKDVEAEIKTAHLHLRLSNAEMDLEGAKIAHRAMIEDAQLAREGVVEEARIRFLTALAAQIKVIADNDLPMSDHAHSLLQDKVYDLLYADLLSDERPSKRTRTE